MPHFTRMIGDQVHVRLVEAAETTPSGKLFIPQAAKQERQKAEVLCVGPKALGLEVGMLVELESYSGETLEGDEMVVHASSVLGVWED